MLDGSGDTETCFPSLSRVKSDDHIAEGIVDDEGLDLDLDDVTCGPILGKLL